MIVDSPIVSDMAIGVDRRIMQEGDSQLLLPASIQSVALAIRPTTTGVLTNVVMQQSVFAEAALLLNNSAPATGNLFTLGAGLWELEMTLASKFDFSSAVGTLVSSDIAIVYRGAGRRLLSRLAEIGSYTDYNRMRLLLDTQAVIQVRGGITALAEHMDLLAIVNAIRIL